jgi:DNA invertase Pin-like site-specific DNA recombinase
VKVALYARVSTVDQDPETQGREVRAFVAARDWEVVATYQDVGVSGVRARRPALDQLIKDAWRGRFEAVVVWDLSRIARSTLNALELLQDLQQMKVRLVAVKQTFDTDTPLGKAFYILAAMFAELERSILIERVRAGMARAKAEGKRIGRPVRILDMEEIRRLRARGFSIRQIARQVGAPISTVAKRLGGSPKAAGEMSANRKPEGAAQGPEPGGPRPGVR